MRTFEIIHLETGKALRTVEAEGFMVNEQGVVTFYATEKIKSIPLAYNVATTQVSSSTLIVEKVTPKPVLVMSSPEEQCTKQS
jgi:hypothetical protein